MNEDARWLTIKELALTYGLSKWTVYKKIKTGELERMIIPPRKIFVKDPCWDHTPQIAAGSTTKEGDNIGKDNVHILRGLEVAMILGVTPRALRYMVQYAKIPDVRTGTVRMSKRRYSINDVRTLIAMREDNKDQKRKKGTSVRAAVLKWALEQLKTTDRTQPAKPQLPHQ